MLNPRLRSVGSDLVTRDPTERDMATHNETLDHCSLPPSPAFLFFLLPKKYKIQSQENVTLIRSYAVKFKNAIKVNKNNLKRGPFLKRVAPESSPVSAGSGYLGSS